MTRNRRYVHAVVSGEPIDSADTTLLTLGTFDRREVTLVIDADVSSDFDLDVQHEPGGSFQTFTSYAATDSVTETLDLAVHSVRVVNTTAQTAGDTATVKVGAV